MAEDFMFYVSDCRRLNQIPSLVHWCRTAANYVQEHATPFHPPDVESDLGAVQEACKIVKMHLASTRPLPLLLWGILAQDQWSGDVESVASHSVWSGGSTAYVFLQSRAAGP